MGIRAVQKKRLGRRGTNPLQISVCKSGKDSFPCPRKSRINSSFSELCQPESVGRNTGMRFFYKVEAINHPGIYCAMRDATNPSAKPFTCKRYNRDSPVLTRLCCMCYMDLYFHAVTHREKVLAFQLSGRALIVWAYNCFEMFSLCIAHMTPFASSVPDLHIQILSEAEGKQKYCQDSWRWACRGIKKSIPS